MALDLKICAGFKDKCSTIVIKDITGAYNVDTNATGWGSPNDVTTDVSEATIQVDTPNVSIEGESVLDSLPTTVTGTFDLTEITVPPLDGEYTITYTIAGSDLAAPQEAKIKIFSSCVVRACIDKMWAKYADAVLENCKCSQLKENNALEAEALYRAMMSSTGCLDANARTAILKKIQRLCELEDCKCA